ncbi:MAG: NrtA/SsuA/CpmA family ABC transporter substrate-binding protein [Armatimonadota bacterium]|nr:NrtA/SsuA/CpmA family ABC transporter substrate-binding protein [Armatimonadota bacterium]MDR7452688.1 NrtA/SsuA/CpmA family ABC transporter substrate-binding protein [Armatimonadota bacterium]MDR7466706.1 NrtA/SsuA/CpmA family ABC transporter substrate-binding protein [Armatimonadota bacterium]MDR7492820.1 NrtA/SsuA/CpmA family ABC transporter substrate-binding protein [Armatimonadota bacterium]MDR7498596.1 NrtA/SsuA/CpmA family ABC transporter substrate-binding protein [Armatimonadota bact
MRRKGVVIVLTALLLAVGAPWTSGAPALPKIRVGIVAAIDQLGTPVALDRGFFEKWGLDVTIATPFPTGVDLLNALQAGEIQMGQVGVPLIGAVLRGMDLVILGNYSGSSSRLGGDNTMAVVSRPGTNITSIRDLRGKRIAVSFGTISHLYILGVLERARLSVNDVTLVNTPPAEMPVALRGGAVDAFATWDPWPVIALREIPGTYEVVRGGGFIGFMGFIVATRQWALQNQETVEKFLAARAEADQFMRANPVKTAEIAVRWLTGMRPEVALRGVRNNLPTLDIRISYYNYLALHNGMTTLHRLGFLPGVFDVNKVFHPEPMLNVMRRYPNLFSDLPPIPPSAMVGPGYVFKAP